MTSVIGSTIKEVRPMTAEEMRAEGWYDFPTTVLVLDDGTKLFASRDDEGNGPGALFGVDKDGNRFA